MATAHTDQKVTCEVGGHPMHLFSPKLVYADVTLGGVCDAANEAVQAIQFQVPTLILAAGIEIVTPTTNAITASLGTGGGGGSATQYMGEKDVSAAAGTHYSGGQGVANVLIAGSAADTLDVEVSGDAGAAGEVRVWAVVAHIDGLDAV